jgi:hypothetical protein
MRLLTATALLGLLALVPTLLAQDGGGVQDPELENLPPLTAYRLAERKRIEKGIVGAWNLVEFRSAALEIPVGSVQGFAMFQDGFLMLNLQARQIREGFLSDYKEYGFQAGTHQYRISDLGSLQTAALQGFSNFNVERELQFEVPAWPREYDIELDGDDLSLIRQRNGSRLMFRRVKSEGLPEKALDHLDRTRGANAPR